MIAPITDQRPMVDEAAALTMALSADQRPVIDEAAALTMALITCSQP